MANQMYSQKVIRYILMFVALCSTAINGGAFASPASYSEQSKADERIEYAVSLNSMASTLMNWYGSLITTSNRPAGEEQANIAEIRFSVINRSWKEHRTTYPKKITGIQIMSADLNKQDTPGQYKFEVEVLMTYMQPDTLRNKLFNEIFLFQTSDLNKPEIKQVTRLIPNLEKSTGNAIQTSAFKHQYYKSREFAYAWLAYMDGVKVMGSRINIDYWLDKANYLVKIGDFELDEQVISSLQKRNQHMGKGGHLLRSITAKRVEGKAHHFELDIIIDWKGTDPSGLPSIAKINQVIQYKLQEDGSWIVLYIKETHLLPDLGPWQKLLC